MFKSFIVVSIRSFLKDKVHAGINLTGLIVGIFSSLVIILYASYELGFDRFHEKKNRIYRVTTSYKANSGLTVATALSPSGLSPELKQKLAAVENSVRLLKYDGVINIERGGQESVYEEKNIFRTEAQLLDIFSYHIIKGNASTALSNPKSIVLSQRLAKKYFGDRDPLNRIVFADGEEYTVTAVIKDIPNNSDLYAEAFISYDFSVYETWNDFDVFTYALLKESANADQSLIDGMAKLVNDNCTALRAYDMKSNIAVSLQALQDVHFVNGLADDTAKGNLNYIYILLGIGVLIIGLVIINYVNLSIMKSIERTTEVGIRKTLGAQKIQLITQFVFEAVLLTFIAFALSVTMLLVFLPYINDYFAIQLSFYELFEGRILLLVFITLLAVGVVSAIYPAFFLSSLNISRGLKGKGRLPSTQRIRKVLLVVQFSISTIAIICTFIIRGQMQYIWDHELGFDQEQVMVVKVPTSTISMQDLYVLRDELNTASMEASVVGSNSYPGGESTPWQLVWTFNKGEKIEIAVDTYYADENFGRLLGIPLLSGRYFQPGENLNDLHHAILVNESFVKFMRWPSNEAALGQRITVFDNHWDIVGVTKDFHYQSLNSKIRPLFIAMVNNEWPPETRLLVKIRDAAGIKMAMAKWKAVTGAPFSFSFLDADFRKQYKNEEALTRISSYFTLTSLLLAGVGLTGLASMLTIHRTKEIGIRKILGGSDGSVILLLLKEFLVLASIGYVIGVPMAWYIMQSWISKFPYQSTIQIYSFVLPAIILFLVTIITTGLQILRSARANPVKSLRYE